MNLTADQLLQIAGIAPTNTLRTRLNESAAGGVSEGVARRLPRVLYHGGATRISEFKIPPWGVYFSPHIDWAQNYGSAITQVRVKASKIYKLDYTQDIDDAIVDALFDRDYPTVAKYIEMLQAQGYQAMQTVSDSEMVVVFPGTAIDVIDKELKYTEK